MVGLAKNIELINMVPGRTPGPTRTDITRFCAEYFSQIFGLGQNILKKITGFGQGKIII